MCVYICNVCTFATMYAFMCVMYDIHVCNIQLYVCMHVYMYVHVCVRACVCMYVLLIIY
jgi:hypothetical protein